jgi:hypothetical protein
MKRLLTSLAVLAWVLVAAQVVVAQPMELADNKVRSAELKLGATDERPGREVRQRGRANDTPKRFHVNGLNVMAPTLVALVAHDRDAPVEARLFRHVWGEPVRTGETGSEGVWIFEGRIHDTLGLEILALGDKPAGYDLVIWQGERVGPAFSNIFTPVHDTKAAPDASGAGGLPLWLFVLLGAIVILLSLVLFKQFRGANLVLLVVALGAGVSTPGPLHAQSDPAGTAPNPFEIPTDTKPADVKPDRDLPSGDKPDEVPNPFDIPKDAKPADVKPDRDLPSGHKPDEVPNPFDIPKDAKLADVKPDRDLPSGDKLDEAPSPFDIPKDAKPADVKPDRDLPSGDKPGEAPNPFDVPQDTDTPDDNATAGGTDGRDEPTPQDSRDGRLSDVDARIDALNSEVRDNRNRIQELEFLIDQDRENVPDPDRLPPLPLSCFDAPPPGGGGSSVRMEREDVGSASDEPFAERHDCQRCFLDEMDGIEELMGLYEQLRIIYTNTMPFRDRAYIVGDALAGSHQLSGLMWARQKADIEQSVSGMQAAYDAKLKEFNTRLADHLDRLGECEIQYGGDPRWRQIEGQLFYHGIANAYRRTN